MILESKREFLLKSLFTLFSPIDILQSFLTLAETRIKKSQKS